MAVMAFSCFQFTYAQDADKRELGLNIRDAWFGSSAHILHRRQKEADRWRRFDISLTPTYNSYRIANQLGNITIPNEFRFQSSGNFSLSYKNVNEHYVDLKNGFFFYHGPSLGFSYSHNRTKRTYQTSSSEAIYDHTLTQSITTRLGYLVGLRYDTDSKFSFGLDFAPNFAFSGTLLNNDQNVYNSTTKLITDGSNMQNELNTTVSFYGAPVFDLWLFFQLGK